MHADVIWDNCSEGVTQLLESVQYESTTVITGAIKGTIYVYYLITLLGILTITINRYYPKGNVRTGQKKPMRGTSLINFTKKK